MGRRAEGFASVNVLSTQESINYVSHRQRVVNRPLSRAPNVLRLVVTVVDVWYQHLETITCNYDDRKRGAESTAASFHKKTTSIVCLTIECRVSNPLACINHIVADDVTCCGCMVPACRDN